MISTLMDAGNEYFLIQYKYWCYFLCMLTKWCATGGMLTTYDTTPQRDIQFYRSELDAMHENTVTWEPYTDEFYKVYQQYAQ